MRNRLHEKGTEKAFDKLKKVIGVYGKKVKKYENGLRKTIAVDGEKIVKAENRLKSIVSLAEKRTITAAGRMRGLVGILDSIRIAFFHLFARRATVQYPDEKNFLPARWRGRIVLTRDPDGGERCVACYLCSVACPVDCIYLQAATDSGNRRYPEMFRINFSRCIFCGFCEDACPTYAIQLIPDLEMCEYDRKNLVYEKEDLLINSQGKYPGYNFYRVAGVAIPGKEKGEGENEKEPVDVKSLLP